MECEKGKNAANCNCTYEPCSRKGICCECIQYHMNNSQVPACFFSKEAEKTYDRSIENFITDYKKKR
ncbi:MAG: hypothetical protein ISS91_03105 [Candidatus Omnitrophica bacterium]|nr:hypothetical protein [Candidatus Omnitrophota bacterium]